MKKRALVMAMAMMGAWVWGETIKGWVYFCTDSAELRPKHCSYLRDKVIPQIREGAVVSVNGHTDPREPRRWKSNQELSEARARTVADFLKQHCGVAGVAFEVRGLGVDVGTYSYPRKRRVDIRIVNPPARQQVLSTSTATVASLPATTTTPTFVIVIINTVATAATPTPTATPTVTPQPQPQPKPKPEKSHPAWLKGAGVEANIPNYFRVGKELQSAPLRWDIAAGRGWVGAGLTYIPTENVSVSLIGTIDEFRSKIVIADIQGNYYWAHKGWFFGVGLDVGKIFPFKTSDIEVEGGRFFSTIGIGYGKGDLGVGLNYSYEITEMQSSNNRSERDYKDNLGLTISYAWGAKGRGAVGPVFKGLDKEPLEKLLATPPSQPPQPPPANHSPLIQILSTTGGKVGEDVVIEVGGYDADGDILSYSVVGPGSGVLTKVSNTRATWRWWPSVTGNYNIAFTVEDGKGGKATIATTLQIIP